MASKDDGSAAQKMRELHALASNYASHMMPLHAHTYLWNDSVLLLAYADEHLTNADGIIREANELKKKIDRIGRCYAIAVKGKTFPELDHFRPAIFDGQIADQPRAIVIKASSFAMANCFLIEEKLGKEHKKPWSIDGRIATHIRTTQKYTDHEIELLPRSQPRSVRLYDGDLW
ncbi:hypothetical protein [Lysobacter sp. TY2-98]|uniref:hypothetical protein n=1 Tax=Lysobacter sp. TY2-98 TaxID=2290922 RepID=UPI0013B3B5C6|nr:hypothetical protein [Lysobacter sp. TY2-98]